MAHSDRVYRTRPHEEADTEKSQLQSRWTEWEGNRLRDAISSSTPLPRIFKPIEIVFDGSTVEVEDLRGADLSGLEIGEYDLAYCALDYAKFEHCRLVGTRLQYSRLVRTTFRSATLEAVQGSPVDARSADFSHARMISSFFSHSNFDGASSTSAEILDCDFTECSTPLTESAGEESSFIYSASDNEALVRGVADYLELGTSQVAGHSFSPPALKRKGPTKFGKVVVGATHADYVVIVQSKPRQTVGGKIIKRQVEYKVSAATTPFSVGDAVFITNLELDERFVSKVAAHKYAVFTKNPTATPKLFKSPSWWIFGRASTDEAGGLEAAEA